MSASVRYRRVETVDALELHAAEGQPQVVDYQRAADDLGITIGELSGMWPKTTDNGNEAQRRGIGPAVSVPMTAFPGWFLLLDEDGRVSGLVGDGYFEQTGWERVE